MTNRCRSNQDDRGKREEGRKKKEEVRSSGVDTGQRGNEGRWVYEDLALEGESTKIALSRSRKNKTAGFAHPREI